MGTYMTVVLKTAYKNDTFIWDLNKILTEKFGADKNPKFNPWYALKSDADYMNNDPEGKKQAPGWERPITARQLSKNCFWLANGEFSFKLSGGATLEEAKEAVAVCKWLMETENQFIDVDKSDNYDKETVAEYLNYLFEDAGSDLSEIWKI
ncbi:hypothetical protein [Chryseobacterium sp. SL1]|uniref:hypothetical protein n=1 Tax=Chryseobacterium sp. SL1 TaxID=2995159 RepID=UPI0022764D5B|nr:hypothetical protein [Chryseobacterium sp. SL1]MCY1662568.1 hypothetical protein [Chryseobacterium sp. SL1]